MWIKNGSKYNYGKDCSHPTSTGYSSAWEWAASVRSNGSKTCETCCWTARLRYGGCDAVSANEGKIPETEFVVDLRGRAVELWRNNEGDMPQLL
jgi:hypothetical protein